MKVLLVQKKEESMKFALFQKEEKSVVISVDDIENRKVYLEKYKGALYCINYECKIPVFFQMRNKTKTKYFKKWPKIEHIDKCPNKCEYS